MYSDYKVVRCYVIFIGQSMYVKDSLDSDFELTGDLMNAKLFYSKEYCIKYANNLVDKFNSEEIEVIQLQYDIRKQSTITIRERKY